MEIKKISGIKSWASDDRPREKLLFKGPSALSDSELLAILIGSGNTKKTAVDIAKEILQLSNNNLEELGKLSLKDMKKINGIGEARSIIISAALELGRRRQMGNLRELQEVSALASSKMAAEYLQTRLRDYQHEVFAVLCLNAANKVKHFKIISEGGLTATIADPRTIFRYALEEGAAAIIICHNHPSGSLQPSQADITLTKKLKEASIHIDMKLLDHIIVSSSGYFSFTDEGLL